MCSTMSITRVLVVDHRHKAREAYRAAIKSIDSKFTVVTVPSGEEALLEFRAQIFNLLVTNFNLPGINGIELISKAKNRNPALKAVLVASAALEESKSALMKADADVIYYELAGFFGFLDSFKQCLALDVGDKQEHHSIDTEEPGEHLSECLDDLHRSLGSTTSVLLDRLGRIQAQIGEFPDSSIVLPLMAVYSANQRAGRFLSAEVPGCLQYFPGSDYDLLLAIVGSYYLLVAIIEPVTSGEDLGKRIALLSEGVHKLQHILMKIGIEVSPESQPIPDKVRETGELEEQEPFLDELFREVNKVVPESPDVDAFWDSITGVETASEPQNADVLSYDQALRLGLGPENETE